MNHFSCKRTPSPQERSPCFVGNSVARIKTLSEKKNKKTIASLLFLLTRAKDQYFSHVFKISFDISVLFQEFNTLYELWC